MIPLCLFFIIGTDLFLNLMIPVFAIRSHRLKFPVSEEIKAHFLNIFLAKLRQNMRNVIRKHAVGRQNQNIRRLQMPPVVIQKIGNPVKCNGSLTTSCRPLNYQNPIFRIADDRILLFLYCTNDVLKLNISVRPKLLLQNLIIDLHITFELIYHSSAANLVLIFAGNLPRQHPCRSLIGSLTLVIIVKQGTDRGSPVINQRNLSSALCKIADSYIKGFCLFLSIINKIHTSEKRRIQHLLPSAELLSIFLIRIYLR